MTRQQGNVRHTQTTWFLLVEDIQKNSEKRQLFWNKCMVSLTLFSECARTPTKIQTCNASPFFANSDSRPTQTLCVSLNQSDGFGEDVYELCMNWLLITIMDQASFFWSHAEYQETMQTANNLEVPQIYMYTHAPSPRSVEPWWVGANDSNILKVQQSLLRDQISSKILAGAEGLVWLGFCWSDFFLGINRTSGQLTSILLKNAHFAAHKQQENVLWSKKC